MPELTKLLAGLTPKYVVKLRLKGKTPASLDSDNEIFRKINPELKF